MTISPFDADACLAILLEAFPEKGLSQVVLQQYRRALQALPVHPQSLRIAMEKLADQDQMPSFRAVKRLALQEDRSRTTGHQDAQVAFWRRVDALKETHGRDFLALNARPADRLCPSCRDYYTPRGVSIYEPLLSHEHFTFEELRDPALQRAVLSCQYCDPEGRPLPEVYHPLRERAIQDAPEEVKALERAKLHDRVQNLYVLLDRGIVVAEAPEQKIRISSLIEPWAEVSSRP